MWMTSCSIGLKSPVEKVGRDLNEHVLFANLGELRLHAGIRFSRDLALAQLHFLSMHLRKTWLQSFASPATERPPWQLE